MHIKKMGSKIDFTNDGELSLFFVGTGTAFEKKNFQNNLLIIKGAYHVLVDCGTLFSYAFEYFYNTKITEIKNLLLTHPHADHIGGVEELILSSRYVLNTKINLIITDEFKKKLWDESLKGGCQYSEDGIMTFNDYFNQEKPILIQKKPFEIYECNIGNINLKLFRTKHVTTKEKSLKNSMISYGLIIDDRVLFTSDTQFCKEQVEYINSNYKIEAIFHDCDIMGYAKGVHASYDELKTFSSDIKGKMFLCHYNSAVATKSPQNEGFAGFVQNGVYYNF